MGGGHGGEQKGEEVVDEGVEGLVGEGAPGEVGHRFEAVVDDQLREHGEEAKGVDAVHRRLQRPGGPGAVGGVGDGVGGAGGQQRREDVQREEAHRRGVEIRGPALQLGHRGGRAPVEGEPAGPLQAEHFEQFPQLDNGSHGGGDQHQEAGLAVVEVEGDDGAGGEAEGDRTGRDALHRGAAPPELNVILEGEKVEEGLIKGEKEILEEVSKMKVTHVK